MRILHRRRGERGASAVEFALTVPLLLILMLGCVELALFAKDHVSMSSSVRSGARSASASADAGPGTCEASGPTPPPCVPANVPALAQVAADTMQSAGIALRRDAIDFVIIYDAGVGAHATFPTTCGSNCVKFVWDDGLGKFRYASGTWKSTIVNACLNDPARDSVGIALQARHEWFSGVISDLMGGDKVMQQQTIMQFEPLEQDRCKPGTPNAHP